MKTNIFVLALLLVMAAFQGCAPSEKVWVSSPRDALPENCPVTLYGVNEQKPAKYESLGIIKLGEKGLSISCQRKDAEAEMQAEACKAGANAIIIVTEKEPDLLSTCYRATAELAYVEGS